MSRPMCQHCNSSPVTRPRGLCWSCYYTPTIKDAYGCGSGNKATSRYASRGVGLSYTGEPTEPTDTDPGSEERIAILSSRAEKGLNLFHPNDAKIVTDTKQRGRQHPFSVCLKSLLQITRSHPVFPCIDTRDEGN